ncbi:MAG: hypothetical protein OXF68_14685 [Gammaproteobacteria bacterium]|nr:hypothetical protein [Gammaproteobacteria bacterium]
MAAIVVNLPDEDMVQDLKLRADRNNRSLEAEVWHILADAVNRDLSAKRVAFLARTAELRSTLKGRQHTPAELLIREDRDFGH